MIIFFVNNCFKLLYIILFLFYILNNRKLLLLLFEESRYNLMFIYIFIISSVNIVNIRLLLLK